MLFKQVEAMLRGCVKRNTIRQYLLHLLSHTSHVAKLNATQLQQHYVHVIIDSKGDWKRQQLTPVNKCTS